MSVFELRWKFRYAYSNSTSNEDDDKYEVTPIQIACTPITPLTPASCMMFLWIHDCGGWDDDDDGGGGNDDDGLTHQNLRI